MTRMFSIITHISGWALLQVPNGLLLAGFLFASLVAFFAAQVPEHTQLASYSPAGITRLYTIDGKLLQEYAEEHRITIPIGAMPDCIKQAFISIEDRRFYSHFGVDLRGLARALTHNLRGGRMQGASTITQQVAKNILLSKERTLDRKLKEMILALRMDKALGKDRILELYLNEIFLGQQSYGVAMAAKRYFAKELLELKPEECALLGALPKAPSYYNPYRNPKKAKNRRNLVLQAMHREGYLDDAQYQTAYASELVLSDPYEETRNEIDHTKASFFAETVRRTVLEKVDEHVFYRGGLSIFTTLDSDTQTIAQQALQAELMAYDTRHLAKTVEAETAISDAELDATEAPPHINGAVVVMDVHTGQVRAMVGGRDAEGDFFNRAVQAKRQPGSAFKPFVYLAALEQGYSPAEMVHDAPLYFTDPITGQNTWEPQNYSHKYYGPTRLRQALERSLNVSTVQLSMVVGLDHIHELAVALGAIDAETPKLLSMVLGTTETTLLQMTTAYAMLANGGMQLQHSLVSHVRDGAGNVVMRDAAYHCDSCATPRHHPPALETHRDFIADPASVSQLVSIMEGVVKRGTARKARKLNLPVAGKTGTTNDSKDSWFIGFTPDYVVGVYAGFDTPTPLGKGETGASVALPIFVRVMEGIYKDRPKPPAFAVHADLARRVIDTNTGMLPRAETSDRYYLSELFKPGQTPTRSLLPYEPLPIIPSHMYYARYHAHQPMPELDDVLPLTSGFVGGVQPDTIPSISPVLEGLGGGIY